MEEQIKELIQYQLGLKNKIKNTDNLIKDLAMDSLDLVELMMILEGEYLVEITKEILDKFETVQDVIDFIEDLKNG